MRGALTPLLYCPPSVGIGARHQSVWLPAIIRNHCPPSLGLRTNVGIKNIVHFSATDPDRQGIERIMWPSSWPEPVRESEEVFLIDSAQHHDDCALENLVLQSGYRQGPLRAVCLRYVRPARRLWSIGSPMDPSVQVFEPRLELHLVVLPCHPVSAGCRLSLQREERQATPLPHTFACSPASSGKISRNIWKRHGSGATIGVSQSFVNLLTQIHPWSNVGQGTLCRFGYWRTS